MGGVHDLVGKRLDRLAAEGAHPREELVEKHAGREQIGAMVDLRARVLLGRHVRRGSDGDARVRQLRAGDAGDAEVGDLDPPRRRYEQVAGLDVAVDDTPLVRVAEGVEQLRHQGSDLVEAEGAAPHDVVVERLPRSQLHDDVRHVVRVAVVVDRDDAGMGEATCCDGFAAEPLDDRGRERAVGEELLVDRLHGDLAIDRRIVRAVHDTHRPFAQDADDPVLAELLRRRRGGRAHVGLSLLVVEHLERMVETLLHPVEGLRERGELVAPRRGEIGLVALPEAHVVRDPRDAGDGANDDES